MNRMKRRLTPEEEDHMVEWLKQNEFLYDKTSERFKMTNQKQKMWADKEEELGGLNPGDLEKKWYKDMRTQYGKITKNVSDKLLNPLYG